jgi:hypothetical protein
MGRIRTPYTGLYVKDFHVILTVTNIDDAWEMGLADLTSLAKYNDKYKYLLNAIDVFSRFA